MDVTPRSAALVDIVVEEERSHSVGKQKKVNSREGILVWLIAESHHHKNAPSPFLKTLYCFPWGLLNWV
jgi:hypothetical protein